MEWNSENNFNSSDCVHNEKCIANNNVGGESDCGSINEDEQCENVSYVVENVSGKHSGTKFELEGNRIVNLNTFLEDLKLISEHNDAFGCTLKNLNLIKEKRLGLNSKLFFICNMCNVELTIHTCKNNNKSINLNYAAVSANTGIGIGYSQINELLGVLDVPCMSQRT